MQNILHKAKINEEIGTQSRARICQPTPMLIHPPRTDQDPRDWHSSTIIFPKHNYRGFVLVWTKVCDVLHKDPCPSAHTTV